MQRLPALQPEAFFVGKIDLQGILQGLGFQCGTIIRGFLERLGHILVGDDAVTAEHMSVSWPEIFIATDCGIPARIMSLHASVALLQNPPFNDSDWRGEALRFGARRPSPTVLFQSQER
jgi:hypothetical protein